jgi:hypothetical protein
VTEGKSGLSGLNNEFGSTANQLYSEIVKLFVQKSEAYAGKTDEAVKEEIIAFNIILLESVR